MVETRRLRLTHSNRVLREDFGDSFMDEEIHGPELPVYDYKRRILVFGMLTLLVLCGTAEASSYSANGAVFMVPYRCFLNQLVVLVCITFFAVIELVEKRRFNSSSSHEECNIQSYSSLQSNSDHESSPENSLTKIESLNLFSLIGLMAVFDTLGLYINLLASHDVGGSLRVILQNLSIPISMGFSHLFLGRTFSWQHIIAALVVFLGIVLCLVNVLRGDQESSPKWACMLAISCIPFALGGCLKELVLISPQKYNCDALRLNKWVAILQFGFGLVLLPLGLRIQNTDTDEIFYVPSSEIPMNFYAGFKCGFLGLNTYESDGLPLYGITNCGSAFISTWIYLFTVCFFNLLMMWVIKEGSAVLFFVANAVIIPVVSLLSTSSLYQNIGLPRDTFTNWQVFGLLLTMIGCFYFGLAMIDRSEKEFERHR